MVFIRLHVNFVRLSGPPHFEFTYATIYANREREEQRHIGGAKKTPKKSVLDKTQSRRGVNFTRALVLRLGVSGVTSAARAPNNGWQATVHAC